MAKWLEALEKTIGGGPGGPKRVKTMRMLLLIGAVGILLMLLNAYLPFQKVETLSPGLSGQDDSNVTEDVFKSDANASSSFEAIERPLESRLKELLEKMVGVGKVEVMVTVDSTEEKVVERHQHSTESVTDENDRNGGKRHVTSVTKDGQVVLYQSSSGQQPIIVKVINPRIRGVLIVAEGAEDAAVRKLITQAVEKGLNVPATRISVVPSKQ